MCIISLLQKKKKKKKDKLCEEADGQRKLPNPLRLIESAGAKSKIMM